jgi:hypothetical protein
MTNLIEKLKDLDAAGDKATQGDWYTDKLMGEVYINMYCDREDWYIMDWSYSNASDFKRFSNDTEFIVQFMNDRPVIKEAIAELERLRQLKTPSMSDMLDSQMCCSGYQCGCQGATNRDYFEYLSTKEIQEKLTQAEAKLDKALEALKYVETVERIQTGNDDYDCSVALDWCQRRVKQVIKEIEEG